MSTYERIAGLQLTIDEYALEGLARTVSSGFHRQTTIIHLRGAGEQGLGEDVTYDETEHERAQERGPEHPLAGEWTFDSFSAHVGALDLFPAGAPRMDAFHHYRRWAYESAALDLALRQAGTSLSDLLERPLQPVRFVVSSRMGEPPTVGPVTRRLARYPELRFKLD